MMENQTEAFWDEKTRIYGGEIRFRSFVRFLGSSEGGGRELSGLLYLIEDRLIFEDFEKESGLLGFLLKRQKEKYEKTLIEISAGNIHSIKRISQREAQRKLAGGVHPTRPISKILAALSVVVHEVILDNGTSFYFEIMNKTALERALDE